MSDKYPFAQNPGEKTMEVHKWDETGKNLVVVEEVDIQDEIDKRARGMTIGEQLTRLAQGDLSVIKDGEPMYGDFTHDPETLGEYIMEGQRAAAKGTTDSITRLNDIKNEIDKLEDGDKKTALLKEYEVTLEKMKIMLGKE